MSETAVSHPAIIVVEDDLGVRNSLQFAFEVKGFDVFAYASGEALLADVTPSAARCLILDYHLPGIDGLTLLHRLRERGDDLSAVLITTPNPEISRRAALSGVRLVEKPLQSDVLAAEVCSLLDPRRARPSGTPA
jgi:two-component system response regulator FixJ